MIDKREQILTRLYVILQTIGVKTVARNRGEVPTQERPCIQLLDGDETAGEGANSRRGVTFPNVLDMSPEIFFTLATKGPKEADEIGPEVNTMKMTILNKIVTDVELKALTGPNGFIHYNGAITDLARGRSMEGSIGLSVTFRYVIHPSDLL